MYISKSYYQFFKNRYVDKWYQLITKASRHILFLLSKPVTMQTLDVPALDNLFIGTPCVMSPGKNCRCIIPKIMAELLPKP